MKFKNCHGKTGRFTFKSKKYSFANGVFECTKDEKDLAKHLKASSAWTDYVPSAEDRAKDLKAENEELKKENEELKAGSDDSADKTEIETLNKLLDEASKDNEDLKTEITELKKKTK